MKDITYKEKIQSLQPVLNDILIEIRRELKNEHLRKDLAFNQKYFSKKALDKITVDDLAEGYKRALEEGNEEAGEWIASRWMLKHPEVYQFFAERLSVINPNFDEIEKIPDSEAKKIMAEAIEEFGLKVTYIFSVLNSVVFPDFIYEELKNSLLTATPQISIEVDEKVTLEDLKKKYDEALVKLTEKYEKKLSSLEKKYIQDTEGFKKQIAALQRRLK